jgi:hypothetical protein
VTANADAGTNTDRAFGGIDSTYTNSEERIVMLVAGEKDPIQVDEWADLRQ